MNKKRILFLYTELADYIVHCINLAAPSLYFKVIHWPINKEAPFKLKLSSVFVEKQETSLNDLLSFKPEFVLISGWIDADYLKWIKKLTGIKVLTMDTQWKGNLKQILGANIFRLFHKRNFDLAWVTGNQQVAFAEKLGFKSKLIFTGFYSANKAYFDELFKEREQQKQERKILYLGRYVKHKGVFELWEAFIELVNEGFSDWKLVCAGTGDQWGNRMEHPNIEHLGFVQPTEMEPVVLNASVYVLPSHVEPWGVSVHEMAAAGLPMILSHEVGSAEKFLVEGENGFSFPAKNKEALKEALRKMMRKPPEELAEMGSKSNQLAQSITPQKWVETMMKIVEY